MYQYRSIGPLPSCSEAINPNSITFSPPYSLGKTLNQKDPLILSKINPVYKIKPRKPHTILVVFPKCYAFHESRSSRDFSIKHANVPSIFISLQIRSKIKSDISFSIVILVITRWWWHNKREILFKTWGSCKYCCDPYNYYHMVISQEILMVHLIIWL